jgi:hypothetical protein
MCLLTNFPLASRILWRCRLHSGLELEVQASADCMKGDCGEDIYAKMNTGKARGKAQPGRAYIPGHNPGHSPGHSPGHISDASDLAPRSSGNQNCGFQGVCVAAVTPFVV